MRFLYRNLWDDYSILSYTSQNGNFPATNTQNPHLTTTWRTLTNGANSIVIDAGSGNTITATCCVISGHNFDVAPTTLKFQMHTADSWGTPDLDIDLSASWDDTHIISFFTSTAKRFIRFYIDAPNNADDFIEIGRFFVGTYLQVSPASLGEFTINNIRNDLVLDSDTNNTYGSYGVSYREFNYNFPPTDYTMINNIRTLWDTVGKIKPWYLLNYDSRWTEIEPAYVRITNNFSEEWRGHNKVSYNFNFREVT